MDVGPQDSRCFEADVPPQGVLVTFEGSQTQSVSFSTAGALTSETPVLWDLSTGLRIRFADAPPQPTVEDWLARAADASRSLAERAHAARRAAYCFEHELERRCEVLFPDFYWRSSHVFDRDDFECLVFPQAKRCEPDDRLTPERDAALRDLGFTHLGDTRLGLTTA